MTIHYRGHPARIIPTNSDKTPLAGGAVYPETRAPLARNLEDEA